MSQNWTQRNESQRIVLNIYMSHTQMLEIRMWYQMIREHESKNLNITRTLILCKVAIKDHQMYCVIIIASKVISQLNANLGKKRRILFGFLNQKSKNLFVYYYNSY
jgi:hypothetical protein